MRTGGWQCEMLCFEQRKKRCRQCLFASDLDSFDVSATFNDDCRHNNLNGVQLQRKDEMLLTIKNIHIANSQRVNRNIEVLHSINRNSSK